jgi:restriction system protein
MRTVRAIIRLAARPGAAEITQADVSQAMAILGQHAASSMNGVSGGLMQLSGVDFEVLVTSLLQRMGFHTELTRTTGDGGIDIVAVLDRPIIGGRYLVQCKRFADGIPVSAAMVRDFYGGFVADRHAVKGLFITTSSFTAQAREFAQGLPIELIAGDQLSALMQQYMSS